MASGQTHGGKGSTARPVDKDKFNSNFDKIFNKEFKKFVKNQEKRSEKKLKRMFNLKRTGIRLPNITRAFLFLGSVVVLYYVFVSLSGV